MIIIEWIIEVFVYEFCGWIGYITVKAVTFGKVELEYGDSSDSVITMWIGGRSLASCCHADLIDHR